MEQDPYTWTKAGLMGVFFIAEAGSNWRISDDCTTNLKEAERLIEAAKEAGADAVKFQMFTSRNTYAPGAGDYGRYGDVGKLFDALSLPKEWLPELRAHCDKHKTKFMASAFSVDDAKAFNPNWTIFLPKQELEKLDSRQKDSEIIIKLNNPDTLEQTKTIIEQKNLDITVSTWRQEAGYINDIMTAVSFITVS
ncbi:MAG: N-acetylneuraminate synthase family protein, partial [Patescibacteria group bacterium]